jgi:S-(hydroxymethyl)glutathione dehydrogenase/alcohol dehydrogenase
LEQAGRPLQVQTLTLADPGPHEVRVRLLATGLCHSDLNFMTGDARHLLPVVLGHEGVGVVAEVGSAVTGVTVGDTVIPYLVPDCGVCDLCRSGVTNNCRTMHRDFLTPRYTPYSRDGRPVGNLMGVSTFAEQTVVHQTQVVKVNPLADPGLACCLACGVTTGIGAVLNTARVRRGSAVVVLGLGGVGLGAVQAARLAGAFPILAVDTNPGRKEVAHRLGATHFIDAGAGDVAAAIRDITHGGADYAFECAGRASLYATALQALKGGAGAMLVGVGIVPADDDLHIRPSQLTGTTITRSFMGNAKRSDVAQYVDWYVDGLIDLSEIVSHRVALDEINEGYDLIRSGEAVRVVVEL